MLALRAGAVRGLSLVASLIVSLSALAPMGSSVSASAAGRHSSVVARAAIPRSEQLGPVTRTVALAVGGAELGLADLAATCAISSAATSKPSSACWSNGAIQQDLIARLAALSGSGPALVRGQTIRPLAQVYADIAARAPQVQLYVTGYPLPFGPNVHTYTSDNGVPSGRACVFGDLRLDYLDALWVDADVTLLNSVIKTAIAQVKQTGARITYVSPRFDGHGLCDSGRPWISGLQVDPATHRATTGSLQPTAAGQLQGYEFAALAALEK